MLPTFLAQFAAGCYLTISLSAIKSSGWRYLRLVAVVCLCLTIASLLFLMRGAKVENGLMGNFPTIALIAACLPGVGWLFVNAAQGAAIRESQRLWPALAGLATLVSAIALVWRPDELLRWTGTLPGAMQSAGLAVSTVLGALLLGCVTAAMLLGHRYLTDTEMSISPLRRMAKLYVLIVIARCGWLLVASWPIWTADFRPRGDPTWFWLMLIIRAFVGIGMTGLFAWMIWDCVKRRATQSATALFYLSMIFVFLGELAGQYLSRTESLAL